MFELVGELEPAGIVGIGVEIGEDFVHATELGGEHALDLLVVEIGEDVLGPSGELDFDVERGAVAGELVGVAQSGEELVLDVPWRPEAVEVEVAGVGFAFATLLESDLAVDALCVHEGADVAVFLRVLNGLQLCDEVVGALLETYVTCGRVHQADSGEIVSGNVSGELAAGTVPTAVTLRLGVETGALAK